MKGNRLSGTGAGVGDRPPVSRVRHLAIEEQHPAERLEVLGKGGDAFPVRRELHDGVWTDTLQQQVAGDQHAVLVIEGDMPVGVTGSMEDPQPFAGQGQVLPVGERGHL